MAKRKANTPIDKIAKAIGRQAGAIVPSVHSDTTVSIADEIYKAGVQTPQDFVNNIAAPGIFGGMKAIGEGLQNGIAGSPGSFDASAKGENVTIFVPNRSSLRGVRGLVAGHGEVRLIAARQFGARSGVLARTHVKLTHLKALLELTEGVSDRQLEALETAVKSGYYASPKKVGIARLAGAMGVDEATFSEHLRKVENKVLPAFAQISRGIKAARAQGP